MKHVVVIGAGPAGLTAAYELLTQADDMKVTVVEETGCIGGISKTVPIRGNLMDIGGHRFITKDQRVIDFWEKMLPLQGHPSLDDKMLGRACSLNEGGPDPEMTDAVLLMRHRISRILFDSKFYDYPMSLKLDTIKNLGLKDTSLVGLSYLRSLLHRLPEESLENYYINHFGHKLYSMFFEDYTENLWGRHPSKIDASWGAQRVKGVSVGSVLHDAIATTIGSTGSRTGNYHTDEFRYPKFGPGQMWETVASGIKEHGGKFLMNTKVCSFSVEEGRIRSLGLKTETGLSQIDADMIISSMPVKDLISGMNNVPRDVSRIADGLPYRDYMVMGVLLKKLNLKNTTGIKTLGNTVPDCWIYVQDKNVKMGRIQIFNNWSPYLVADPMHTIWVGPEYFVSEGDELWSMSDEEFSRFVIREMTKLGLIDSPKDVLDTHLERIRKAYPAYCDTYSEMDKVRSYLLGIDNLYCVGRNGQHRYNNMDHSMITSFETVRSILQNGAGRADIWAVNTE